MARKRFRSKIIKLATLALIHSCNNIAFYSKTDQHVRTRYLCSCNCDLDLDPMTLYELDRDIRKLYSCIQKMNFLGQVFQELKHYRHWDRQTDRHTDKQTH